MPLKNRSTIQRNYSYRPLSTVPRTSENTPHRHTGRRLVAIVLVLLIIAVSGAYAHAGADRHAKPPVTAPSASASSVSHSADAPARPGPSTPSSAQIAAMGTTINQIINDEDNNDVDISVSLVDLTNGQTEHYGEDDAFTAASTTKLITAADFLQEVEKGQQSLTETINGNTAEYELQQMIVVSDDNSWNAMRTLLGYPQLQAYAHSVGATSFQATPNTVTSNDMALFLQKLYQGQLLNASNTALLLSYMKEANYRQYIVPAVPSSDTIYHKVGFYEDFVHDEAIITNGSKAFIIVIFTNGNGTYGWSERAETMQQITTAALNTYF